MYENVPEHFVPESAPELIYANPCIDYVHNTESLNATYEILERGIKEDDRAEDIAIRSLDTGEHITFGDLHSRVEKFASVLKDAGVESGDRVFWRLGEIPAAHVVQLAIWKVGGVNVPSALPEGAREIEYFISDTKAKVVVAQAEGFEAVEEALENTLSVEEVFVVGEYNHEHRSFEEAITEAKPDTEYADTAPSDAASIFYTGGTTGKPKGCVHPHAAEVAVTDLEAGEGRALSPEDTMFCPAPLGHAFGNGEKINFPLRHGAMSILTGQPSPSEMIEVIEDYGVTIFVGAPTMLRMMMNEEDLSGRDLDSVRLVVMSGEMFDEQTYENWIDQTGVENTCNVVGMTPMRHIFVTSYRDGKKIAPGLSVGKPYAGYEAKVVGTQDTTSENSRNQPGRLAIRGPTTINYWNNIHPDMPDRMDEDSYESWALLDDAYERDDDGWLWFKTRLDNMIVSGGRQIAAPEVEEVLNDHPAVAESAVVGKPDKTRGEIVKAFVTLAPDATPNDETVTELQDHAKSVMAKYKYPREIEFREELPKDEVGKLQRAELRDQA